LRSARLSEGDDVVTRNPLPHRRRARILLGALALLILVALFEVVMRSVQPDALRFVEADSSGRTLITVTVTQAAQVAGWYRYVNNERSLGVNAPCHMPLETTRETFTFTFTWHGAPIESLSGNYANVCGQYKVSAGGIPDPFDTYFLTNPFDHGKTPPPVGYQQVP
jgi:hypothetical protein